MDELVFFLTSLSHGESSFAEVAENFHLVRMILNRHYWRTEGVTLPPRAEVQQVVMAHRTAIGNARQQGAPEGQLPCVIFPRW